MATPIRSQFMVKGPPGVVVKARKYTAPRIAYQQNYKRCHRACPGNHVKWIDAGKDLFSGRLEKIYHFLAEEKRFDQRTLASDLANFKKMPASSRGNPILNTSFAKAIVDTIRGARETIFVDIFLLGGSWGLEILRQLLVANDRGVEVVVLHDTETTFAFAQESHPLWQAFVAECRKHKGICALRSRLHHPGRPSSLPFGMEQIADWLSMTEKEGLSLSGRSDHSKILIADGFSRNGKMMVSSKNWIDSGGSYFHDEGVVVAGPAVREAQKIFLQDLMEAAQLAKKEGYLESEDAKMIDSWLHRDEAPAERPRRACRQPAFDNSIQFIQNNVDGSIRNLNTTLAEALASARDTISMYGRMAYNPKLVQQLSAAVKRGVKLRIILDQGSEINALMNGVLPMALEKAGVKIDGCIRWFKPLDPVELPDRPSLYQELHAKTMIIDDQKVILGSSNFDAPTATGGFREFSILVEGQQLAQKSLESFENIWTSHFVESHQEFLQSARWLPRWLESFSVRRIFWDMLRLEGWRIKA